MEQFVQAARICREARLDGVQIHNAHGYLLSNFLNPGENHRTDEYGGSLENRFRLPGRILKAVRAACGPDFAVLVKADANGCGDLHGLLERYQRAGVDGVEISGVDFFCPSGGKGALLPPGGAGGQRGHSSAPDPGGRGLFPHRGGTGAGSRIPLCVLRSKSDLSA